MVSGWDPQPQSSPKVTDLRTWGNINNSGLVTVVSGASLISLLGKYMMMRYLGAPFSLGFRAGEGAPSLCSKDSHGPQPAGAAEKEAGQRMRQASGMKGYGYQTHNLFRGGKTGLERGRTCWGYHSEEVTRLGLVSRSGLRGRHLAWQLLLYGEVGAVLSGEMETRPLHP